MAFGVWRLAFGAIFCLLPANLSLKVTNKIYSKATSILRRYDSHFRYRLGFSVEDSVVCSPSQVQYLIRTTNNIIHYDNGTASGYFRECRQHEDEMGYLRSLAREYFTLVDSSSRSGPEFTEFLMSKLKDDAAREKFFRMGMNFGVEYPASRTGWAKYDKTRDASVIGIDDVPECFSGILYGFARFARWAVYDYRLNSSLFPRQYHSYFTGKMKAARIIAELCGASHIIPGTKYICLKIGGTVKLGVSVDRAQGINPNSMAGKDFRIAPGFQRDMLIMTMLDVICLQQDHRPGNYFCILDNAGNISGISVFDNDAPSTFDPNPSVTFSSYNREAPLVLPNGTNNRPFMDKAASECMLGLSDDKIYGALSGHLSELEIFMLTVRVRKLQRAVSKSLHEGTLSLLKPEEFTRDTVLEELSGKYGITQMKFFADKYKAEIAD